MLLIFRMMLGRMIWKNYEIKVNISLKNLTLGVVSLSKNKSALKENIVRDVHWK